MNLFYRLSWGWLKGRSLSGVIYKYTKVNVIAVGTGDVLTAALSDAMMMVYDITNMKDMPETKPEQAGFRYVHHHHNQVRGRQYLRGPYSKSEGMKGLGTLHSTHRKILKNFYETPFFPF